MDDARTNVAAILIPLLLSIGCNSALAAQSVRVLEERSIPLGSAGNPLVEPHLVAHPSDAEHLLGAVIVTAEAEREERLQRQRCVSFLSTDGGHTWNRHEFPIVGCYDPWVAITPGGHAVFTALGGHPDLPHQGSRGLLVYHSADGGRTWDDDPVGLGRGHDHQTVTVDHSTPDRENWLYVLSSRSGRADHGKLRFGVFVARSRNGGAAFDAPLHLRPNNLLIKAEMPAVLSDGSLIASFVEAAAGSGRPLLVRRRAWMVRSEDGGHSFSLPMFINEACGPPPTFQLSNLVVDHTSGPFQDRLYFSCNLPHNSGIVVSHSADGGETWSDPVRVHEAPADSLAPRRLMAAGVNPDGVLGVAWADGRAVERDCYDVYFAASLDGGVSFLPEQRISTARSCPDPDSEIPWREGGDYYGLAANADGRFRLVWSDARDGEYELRSAVVDVQGAVRDPT